MDSIKYDIKYIQGKKGNSYWILIADIIKICIYKLNWFKLLSIIKVITIYRGNSVQDYETYTYII